MKTEEDKWLRISIDVLFKLGALAVLLIWCYRILEPFLIMIIWGTIIAVASYPTYEKLQRRFNLSDGVAAVLMAGLLVTAIIVPVLMISDIVIDGSKQLLAEIKQGGVSLPLPPESVKNWPVVGPKVWELWNSAAHNLMKTLTPFQPQLKAAGKVALGAAGGVSMAILQFVFSIVVAGALLAKSDAGSKLARRVARRLVGRDGVDIIGLVSATIRSVTRGILGVAFIQSMLAGIGFAVMGIPMAGLLTLVCLILCIVQLGTALVAIPVVIYVFSVADTVPAVIFTVYMAIIGVIDNILKPLLLGRGVKVPMLVIFVGAIGGFLAAGIIGLFVGAVFLVLGYQLGTEWLKTTERRALEAEREARSEMT
ncbi:MAG TPA: AI-2E family transporter [Dongiaceae bacterium]|nr:AI-2E family transporter [Dongiaceae bacterium]